MSRKRIIFRRNWRSCWPILILYKLFKRRKKPKGKLIVPGTTLTPDPMKNTWIKNFISLIPSLVWLLRAWSKEMRKKYSIIANLFIKIWPVNRIDFKEGWRKEVNRNLKNECDIRILCFYLFLLTFYAEELCRLRLGVLGEYLGLKEEFFLSYLYLLIFKPLLCISFRIISFIKLTNLKIPIACFKKLQSCMVWKEYIVHTENIV